MPIGVVGKNESLLDLRDRLARPGLTENARKRVETLLKAANPHLDFTRLAPGTLVSVPDAPEIDTGAGDDASGAFLGDGGAWLAQALDGLAERAASGAKLDTQKRESLREALGSRKVLELANEDARLGERVRLSMSALPDRAKEAESNAKQLAFIVDQARRDVTALAMALKAGSHRRK